MTLDLPDFTSVVEKVRAGREEGAHELQAHFFLGTKYLLTRQLGSPARAADLAREVLAAVQVAICNGELGQPERLASFVRTVAKRTVASQFPSGLGSDGSQRRVGPDPIRDGDIVLSARILRSLPDRDSEVLIRSCVEEQSEEDICRDMGLTPGEIQLVRSRARTEFANSISSRNGRRKAARV